MSPSASPESANPTQRVALVIQYLGAHFFGWQRQTQGRTVQSVLESVIESVTGETVTVHCAGRTDSGVHAAGQVAHFDTASPIPAQRWMQVLNGRLPEDVLIRASAAVNGEWHARFSADYRRYRYTLYTDPLPNLFLAPQVWHYYQAPLVADLIQEALEPLVGHHHLSAFERAGSDRPHSWVDVQEVQCQRRGPLVEIEVQAKGFLYGMMRFLVGMLVRVGEGSLPVEEFERIWREEQRELVKHSAPAKGLCLLRVGYSDSPFPLESWYNTQPLYVLPSDSHAADSLTTTTSHGISFAPG